ncbi:hypothetical protein FP435_00160 (plasmid) [Lactobacillus sp. PV037]|uniref:hypothetical protein n=1 Tax=Lactobacillus sp. PV037 TaxID=2594496 RepID=UPI002240BEE2|nr:hypothetical protein [Lactobacillus sp. PV037]QNQ82951.1 hypothetical protein FP435_00160 [Lactobacillus sp. PV037]
MKKFLLSKYNQARFGLSVLGAFYGAQVLSVGNNVAFAQEADSTDAFSTHVDTSGGANGNFLANVFNSFVPIVQNVGAVLLVLATIILGIKIGVSGAVGDARGRMSSIQGIFYVLVGAAFIINARGIVGLVVSAVKGSGAAGQ